MRLRLILLLHLVAFSSVCRADDFSWLVPLNDLGPAPYRWGYFGGLYPESSNEPPAVHLAAGRDHAKRIQPLDVDGQPSPSGKIVFLAIGPGEIARIMCSGYRWLPCDSGSFMAVASNDARVDHQALVFVNAAGERMDAFAWTPPPISHADYYAVVNTLLPAAGCTPAQVQVVWMELMTNFPLWPLGVQNGDAYRQENMIGETLRELKRQFPNLQIAYISSRVYGGYATTNWNPEPFAYENALSARFVLNAQITQVATGGYWDSRIGDVNYKNGKVPWLAWGPYLWANGTTPRSDGLRWTRDDFESDGESLTTQGAHKGAMLLFDFLLRESTATPWFLAAGTQPPAPKRVRPARP